MNDDDNFENDSFKIMTQIKSNLMHFRVCPIDGFHDVKREKKATYRIKAFTSHSTN
jgi:hypothetical protein